ncbi:CHASE3 domain-containing protein [Actinophytocola glycyrrhizae]|uniref:CHASE3 domain-containing protein n=1 Tax=Actinophytocola glycyrrhizae TaxID=2044873 RepID=A0ABV9S6G2_9PSEU
MRPSTLRWRLYVLVGGLVMLLLVAVAATTLTRQRVADLSSEIRGTLRPAQSSAAALAKAYVDMETGVRGYQLSGAAQLLEPYDNGSDAATGAHEHLSTLLAADPAGTRLLASVDRAATDWERAVAAPALRGERSAAATDKARFDSVRGLLTALQSHIDRSTAAVIQAWTDAQALANLVTIMCGGVAMAIGGGVIVLLRRSLVRPVNDLVANVRRVARGNLSHPVSAHGPAEVVTVGDAVESMRQRILSESARAARSAEQLVRLHEADRIAQNLADTTIRDLFGISLSLQSVAARHPSAAPALRAVTADVDRVLHELRSKVFDGDRSIADVLSALEPELPGPAAVTGPADTPAPMALETLLREVLPLYPATPSVTITTADTDLRVRVTGPTPPDPAPLKQAAEDHWATITFEPDHVTIEWSTER